MGTDSRLWAQQPQSTGMPASHQSNGHLSWCLLFQLATRSEARGMSLRMCSAKLGDIHQSTWSAPVDCQRASPTVMHGWRLQLQLESAGHVAHTTAGEAWAPSQNFTVMTFQPRTQHHHVLCIADFIKSQQHNNHGRSPGSIRHASALPHTMMPGLECEL